MNENRGQRIAGVILHLMIGGLMLVSGAVKLLGLVPQEAREQMAGSGIGDNLALIGAGEVGSALLLIVPRTLSIGVLLTSAFWGGAICLHMEQKDPYVVQSVLLALTWIGAWLRCPALLASLRPAPRPSLAPTPAPNSAAGA